MGQGPPTEYTRQLATSTTASSQDAQQDVLTLLIDMRNGGVAIDLHDALEEVVQGVRNTGKTGKVTLTLTVAPISKGPEATALVIVDDIKSKVPVMATKPSVFFVDDANRLTKQDTRQATMFEEEVKRVEIVSQRAEEVRRVSKGGV